MDSFSLPDLKADPALSSQLGPSASVQTRLSDASSQSRHRVLGQLLPEKNLVRQHDLNYTAMTGSEQNSLGSYFGSWVSLLGFACDTANIRQRLAQNSRLKCLLLVYCGFCVVFLSSGFFSRFLAGMDLYNIRNISDRNSSSSPIQSLPVDHLVSKITSIQQIHQSLKPYVMRAFVVEDTVTACLWTELENVDMLSAWAARWKSYISLVVTTRAPSLNRTDLIHKLQKLHSANSTISVHVLHLQPDSPDNPNAFLNLARLFAETSTVALFPGNLSAVPAKTFSRSLLSKRLPSTKPAIYSLRGQTTYPFSPLSPLVLERDGPLWCTERFFPYLSRSADWLDCLWQVWLENFGDVEVRLTTDWIGGAHTVLEMESSLAQSKVRRRLSTKFRSETCILATRQLAALRTSEHGVDARKARWLKRNCREWITG